MAAKLLNKDVLSGLLFIGFGAAFLVVARAYDFGTARRMGPAFFPIILSSLLMLIGLSVALRGLLTGGPRASNFAWRGLVLVLGASVLYAMLVQTAGLAPATIVLVLIGAYGSREFRWRPTLLLAVALAIFCSLVFTRLLGLPVPVIGPLLGG
jgi:hypothetical protein